MKRILAISLMGIFAVLNAAVPYYAPIEHNDELMAKEIVNGTYHDAIKQTVAMGKNPFARYEGVDIDERTKRAKKLSDFDHTIQNYDREWTQQIAWLPKYVAQKEDDPMIISYKPAPTGISYKETINVAQGINDERVSTYELGVITDGKKKYLGVIFYDYDDDGDAYVGLKIYEGQNLIKDYQHDWGTHKVLKNNTDMYIKVRIPSKDREEWILKATIDGFKEVRRSESYNEMAFKDRVAAVSDKMGADAKMNYSYEYLVSDSKNLYQDSSGNVKSFDDLPPKDAIEKSAQIKARWDYLQPLQEYKTDARNTAGYSLKTRGIKNPRGISQATRMIGTDTSFLMLKFGEFNFTKDYILWTTIGVSVRAPLVLVGNYIYTKGEHDGDIKVFAVNGWDYRGTDEREIVTMAKHGLTRS